MKWLLFSVALLPVVGWAQTNQPAPDVNSMIGMQSCLRYLVMPQVTFRDTDPREVVAYLREQSGQLAGDKQPVNVAWLIAPEEKLPRITLNLTNISLEDALKYTVMAAGLRYRVDAHAVVIYRPEPPAPPPPPKTDAQP